MASARGLQSVGYLDCPGGGQVVVDGTTAFVGHMEAPHGTSIVDVANPANPRLLAEIEVPPGVHSHKVRVGNGIMIVNQEIHGKAGIPPPPGFRGGYAVYDIATPQRPRLLHRWGDEGRGVHRFDFDGRFGYMSPTLSGYAGNIVAIIDFADPERPQEVGRWWKPGQWTGGGEEPDWEATSHRCHHPLRLGNRLYTSYWMGGMFILDISDMARPRAVAHVPRAPGRGCPIHTALPLPYAIDDRELLLLAEEDVIRTPDEAPAALWMFDIGDETDPTAIGSYQVEGLRSPPLPTYSACHQPSERIAGTEIPVAYFAQGLRIVDVSRPHDLRETACFVPDPAPGFDQVQSNDVTIDDRGLLYLIDRFRGLHILERTARGDIS